MKVFDGEQALEKTGRRVGNVRPRFESPPGPAKFRSGRRVTPTRKPLLALASAGLLSVSCAMGPASPTDTSPTGGQEVRLDVERATAYWSQFERRLPFWFDEIRVPVPTLPPRDTVLTEARFIEIAREEADTCWFDPPDRLEIRADMWESGCVPHEIGHLALKMAGHPCWSEWEHPADVKKCQGRFQR